MKQQLPQLYAEYGRYINKFRAFPYVKDGLKIVQRRLLYSLYELAKDHCVKSAKIVGHCIGNYHPHGDVSSYQALVSLVQSGLAVGQGNWGNDYGVDDNPPAAQRYTEVKMLKDLLDIAFEYIKYVPFEPIELEKEPIFFPTKLPFCLLGRSYCQGIGFGSKTLTPTYKKSDLIKRLAWLLKYEKEEPIIRPYTDCEYISKDDAFKTLLTTGKVKIDFQGILQIQNQSVLVRSVPPLRTFSAILNALEKEIQIEKVIGISDESTTSTKVRFTILKPKSLRLNGLVEKLTKLVQGSVSFECNMCDDNGNVVLVSVDQMLLNTYNNYKSIVQKFLIDNIAQLEDKIVELNLIAEIKKVLPKWIQLYPDDPEKVIASVSTDTKIDVLKVKELFDKYTITRLLKIKVDIEEVKINKTTLENNLANIDKYVWDEKYLK